MEIFSLIVIWVFVIWVVISGYYSCELQKKNIKNLIENGKKAKAKVIDYISFRTYDGDNFDYVCYPLLEIDTGYSKFLHLCVRTDGCRSNFVRKDFPIGSIVDVYYFESNESIVQLNWENKIFLNKKYNKLAMTFDLPKVFVLSTMDQKLSSDKGVNIPDLPNTNIKENDIWIVGSSLEKTSLKLHTRISLYLLAAAIFFTFMVIKFG